MSAESRTPKVTPSALIWKVVRPFRLKLSLSCLLAAGSGLAEISAFWLLYLLALEVLGPAPEIAQLTRLSLILVGLALLRIVLLGAASVISHAIAFSAVKGLRLDLLDGLRATPLADIETKRTTLRKSLVEYPAEIEHFIAHTIPDVVNGVTSLIVSVVILLTVEWRLGAVSLLLLPIAFLAQVRMFKAFEDDIKPWFAADRQASKSMQSYVRGIVTLKSFNRKATSFRDIESALNEMASIMTNSLSKSAYPYSVFLTAVSGSLLFIAPFSLWMVQGGQLDPALSVLFVTLGAQVCAPLMRLMFANGGLQRLNTATKLISGVYREGRSEAAPADVPIATGDIEIRDVSFDYGGAGRALTAITLTIPAAKVTAIVGANGAGKSTLLRLLAGDADPSSGRIEIGGADITTLPRAVRSAQVSTVFQNPYFFRASLRANLTIAKPGLSDAQITTALDRVGLGDWARHLPDGLETSVGERGSRLSGGERQRLSIARALIKDAPILLLDEATAYADPESELEVQQAIAEVAQDRTVVVVAHRLATIVAADQIAVLNAGKLEAVADHATLLCTSPTYQEMWASQDRAMNWRLASEVT